MNIAIIGATGMVGARTAAEAISRGHRVDAYTPVSYTHLTLPTNREV